jgi:hypothetical protein
MSKSSSEIPDDDDLHFFGEGTNTSATGHLSTAAAAAIPRRRSVPTVEDSPAPASRTAEPLRNHGGKRKQASLSMPAQPGMVVEPKDHKRLGHVLCLPPQQLVDLITHQRQAANIDRMIVVDCRYPYEHSAGHIKVLIDDITGSHPFAIYSKI